jgi:tripartite ATP-independent transporter DctM subunit
MEWWQIFSILIGGLIVLMLIGMPVAFAFLSMNTIFAFFMWGGLSGLDGVIRGIFDSITKFSLLPLPLFILMGEAMYNSGLVQKLIDALDKLLGRMPGRLGLLALGGGTLLSTLTGASMGSTAMLGSTLVPEMEKRGYKKPMSLGPILGSGGLAIMIPPSALAVLFGAIGEMSIGRLLIAIILPGILMACLYAAYIVIRCWLQPEIAPPYDVEAIPLAEKLLALIKYVLPLGVIVFLVVGVIFVGIATPTEAAATGCLGTFLLAAAYRSLTWDMVRKSFRNAFKITIMMLMIIAAATVFSQIMAFSGATAGLVTFTAGLPLPPVLIIVAIMLVLIFLGMFMGVVPIMMITVPIFMPVITELGFDPLWFAVIFLLNMEMSTTSPPFGLSLFVMKSVAPPDTTMASIYRAALPFLYLDVVAIALIMAFPALALWLPSIMY